MHLPLRPRILFLQLNLVGRRLLSLCKFQGHGTVFPSANSPACSPPRARFPSVTACLTRFAHAALPTPAHLVFRASL